jgi:hypothetical protein
VSLLTRDEVIADYKAGNLTDEAKAILESLKDKLQGNNALAASVI